jgi:hypothetical protein
MELRAMLGRMNKTVGFGGIAIEKRLNFGIDWIFESA